MRSAAWLGARGLVSVRRSTEMLKQCSESIENNLFVQSENYDSFSFDDKIADNDA